MECPRMDERDHVHSEILWFFWDETEAHRYGPYKTEEMAREALDLYGRWLNTGQPGFDIRG